MEYNYINETSFSKTIVQQIDIFLYFEGEFNMDECNLEWDATPSWSGYNYQGKVALYVALDKICELYINGSQEEISDFCLELEWIEDFSIIHNVKNKKIYKSIHQVKALDTTDLKDYGEAIFGLALKVIEYNTINEAYLHTWKSINITESDWKCNIKNLAEKHCKESNLISNLELLLADASELTNIYKRIIKPKPGSVPNIIKRIQPNIEGEITIDTIRTAINKAIVFAKQDNNEFINQLTDERLLKIHLYGYGEDNYCDLESIKDKILKKIDNHLELQGGDWRKSEPKYKEIIYHYLMAEIDKNVIARHKTYAEGNKITISFRTFEDILENQSLSDRSKEYYLFHLKNKFFELHNDYCKRCKKRVEGKENCISCNLLEAIEDVKNMNLDTFEKFCRILCADVKGDVSTIEVFQKIFESTGVNSCFFKALRDIQKKHETKGEMIRYTTEDKKTLLLTALADKGTDDDPSYVCLNIIQNKEIDGLLMDIDELVSKDIDEESIWICANKINMVEESTDTDLNSSDHICHCKRVSIKPVGDVTRRLNK